MGSEALDWNAFMQGEIKAKTCAPSSLGIVGKTAAGVHMFLIPRSVFAASADGGDTWLEIFSTVLNIADWLCVGIIVFSGVTWMFGNRTKAMELIMGGGAGYLIIRHAVDIRNWLKTL